MYVNNWNGRDGQNDQNNQYNQYNPYRQVKEPNQGLYMASLILGGLTIVTTMMMTVYLPLILGGISIILGILSRGNLPRLPKPAKTGITLAIAGLILNIAVVGGSIYTVFTNPEVRAQFDSTFEQMYGESFDDMMNELQSGEQQM